MGKWRKMSIVFHLMNHQNSITNIDFNSTARVHGLFSTPFVIYDVKIFLSIPLFTHVAYHIGAHVIPNGSEAKVWRPNCRFSRRMSGALLPLLQSGPNNHQRMTSLMSWYRYCFTLPPYKHTPNPPLSVAHWVGLPLTRKFRVTQNHRARLARRDF